MRRRALNERLPPTSRPIRPRRPAGSRDASSRIEGGLDQLEAWLDDVMLQGLAAVRAQPAGFWTPMAARLVDAQAPGLARRVGDLEYLAVSGPDWQSVLLAGLARLQLAVDAYRRLDILPDALAAELRSLVGWTQSQDALLQRDGVRDRWHVIGHLAKVHGESRLVPSEEDFRKSETT